MATKTKPKAKAPAKKDAAARKRSEASRKAAETRKRNAEAEARERELSIGEKLGAANPAASLAGHEKQTLQQDGIPLKVTTDGARATLELEKHDPLSQADLLAAIRLLSQAVQSTY